MEVDERAGSVAIATHMGGGAMHILCISKRSSSSESLGPSRELSITGEGLMTMDLIVSHLRFAFLQPPNLGL